MPGRDVDLNELRRIVLQAQKTGKSDPTGSIVVTRDAEIILASDARPSEIVGRPPLDTFHGRLDEEAKTVARNMPRGTCRHTTRDGTMGWHYEFECSLRRSYTMFAYFDGAFYQVFVLLPQLEKRYQSAHTGHIFNTGRICFGIEYNNGRPTLCDAYTKSVLWANGISLMLANGDETFPFSANNL